MPIIHYIWVGPPATDKYLGQDIIGPDLMALRYPTQPIIFFCLKEQLSHYQAHFSNNKNITVRSIEDYLLEQSAPTLVSNIIEKLKERAERLSGVNRFRDLVTLKASFQYYLQTQVEGYIMDSNVTPVFGSGSAAALPKLKEYNVPVFFETRDNIYFDPWMMFALGIKRDPESESRLTAYLNAVAIDLALESQNELDDFERHLALGSAFVRASQWAGETTRMRMLEIGAQYRPAPIKALPPNGTRVAPVSVNDVPTFRKLYFNTHKHSNTKSPDPACDLMRAKDFSVEEFRYLIEQIWVDRVNHRIIGTDQQAESTLAHEAVFCDNAAALKILLPHLKSFELSVGRPSLANGQPMSIQELAEERLSTLPVTPLCLQLILYEKLDRWVSNPAPLSQETLLLMAYEAVFSNHLAALALLLPLLTDLELKISLPQFGNPELTNTALSLQEFSEYLVSTQTVTPDCLHLILRMKLSRLGEEPELLNGITAMLAACKRPVGENYSLSKFLNRALVATSAEWLILQLHLTRGVLSKENLQDYAELLATYKEISLGKKLLQPLKKFDFFVKVAHQSYQDRVTYIRSELEKTLSYDDQENYRSKVIQ